ncbi:MAG: cytochrome c maturation protein CcmE [Deltaproteobacteria bacterium]|nr:cytochrome c maturation protein CcmE [Deltaproteobacteria bacterium]
MTEAARRRLFLVAALGVAGTALGVISLGDLGDDLVYYWSPAELVQAANASEATVRLGGMVVPGSFNWDKTAQITRFSLSDGKVVVPVEVAGNPPQMFREGIGAVVEGKLGGDGVFRSDKVMVKHNNEYQAPENGEKPNAMMEDE